MSWKSLQRRKKNWQTCLQNFRNFRQPERTKKCLKRPKSKNGSNSFNLISLALKMPLKTSQILPSERHFLKKNRWKFFFFSKIFQAKVVKMGHFDEPISRWILNFFLLPKNIIYIIRGWQSEWWQFQRVLSPGTPSKWPLENRIKKIKHFFQPFFHPKNALKSRVGSYKNKS